jgi:copper(I)-binding protein
MLFAAPAQAAQTIAVSDGWSRPAIDTGVVYFTIHNRGRVADRLIEVASPVAQHVEMHRTETVGAMGGMSMGSSTPGMAGMPAGAMEMQRVRAVTIPAGGTVTFAPGGYHVMLIGLHQPLQAGKAFPVRLDFVHAGWIAIRSQVRGV